METRIEEGTEGLLAPTSAQIEEQFDDVIFEAIAQVDLATLKRSFDKESVYEREYSLLQFSANLTDQSDLSGNPYQGSLKFSLVVDWRRTKLAQGQETQFTPAFGYLFEIDRLQRTNVYYRYGFTEERGDRLIEEIVKRSPEIAQGLFFTAK